MRVCNCKSKECICVRVYVGEIVDVFETVSVRECTCLIVYVSGTECDCAFV